MKALLMHPDRDFDAERALPKQHESLTQDLELETLWSAMADGDKYLHDVAQKALLLSMDSDGVTVEHRQLVLADAVSNPDVIRSLYAFAVDTLEGRRKLWFSGFMDYPTSILNSSVQLMKYLVEALRKLRGLAEARDGAFKSPGLLTLFATLQTELDEDYLAEVAVHLKRLKFDGGILMTAKLGRGAEGVGYTLRLPPEKRPWWERILHRGPPQFGFRLHERDDAGARFLSELADKGVNLAANALAQSCDHVLSFFETLRLELGFYVACLNLHEKIRVARAPSCMPRMADAGTSTLKCADLRDVGLVLKMGSSVVGNTISAEGKGLIVVTGANQGGKSSFLRACGVAQLMMQAGIFVCAEAYSGERCEGLFTHYKREEDSSLRSGKLDEELARLSDIAECIGPRCMFLSNESFASTNELEGSEIALQVVQALRARNVKVIAVSHLFDFASRLAESRRTDTMFLRAERRQDGSRPFRLIEGEALSTSFGADLFGIVFGPEDLDLKAGTDGFRRDVAPLQH